MYKDMNGGMTTKERISPFTLMLDEVLERLEDIKNSGTMFNGRDGWVMIEELLLICKRPQKHYSNPIASLRQLFNSMSRIEKKKINNRNYNKIKGEYERDII